MIFLYKLITFLIYYTLYPVARKKAAKGNVLWRGRLGFIDPVGPKSIWMHAASVGEVKVLDYLINYLTKQNKSLTIHATVMTPAGLKTAIKLFGDKSDCVTFSCFPLDAPPVIRRTLDIIKPALLVIAETEIWPNLITQAAGRNIPIILINGRMSEKASKRYRFIRSMLTRLLAQYDHFFFKTESDYMRFRKYGVSPDRSVIAGDMKFDAPLLPRSEGRRSEMRFRAGIAADNFLLVAGSTRPGEEIFLANTFRVVHAKYRHFRMIIAPRHIDRAGELISLLKEKGIPCETYGHTSRTNGIVVVDRMGILNDLYMMADLAFVGGTLVDIGGHNILEPVWAGTPVIFGPYLSNVADAADYILENNYGEKVQSESDLTELLIQAIAGNISFTVKTENSRDESSTAIVGEYILKRLKNV